MFKKYICGGDCETYLNNLFNSMNEGVLLSEVICDSSEQPIDFKILETNKSFEKMFNVINKNILDKTINELYPDACPKMIEAYRQIESNGKSVKFDIYLKEENRHFRINVISPAKCQIIALIDDIADIVKVDEILKKHAILFENAHDVILYLKMDGSIIDANKKAIETYGYTDKELSNMKLQHLRHPSTMKDYKAQMELSAAKGVMFETIHVKKDGTSFPVEVSSRSINFSHELIRIHVIRDITDRKQADEKIKYLANYDALTDIPNRGYLMRQLESTLEQSKRGNFKFAVILFDVDKFKMINDVYGHNAGDVVLKKVAGRLKDTIRKSDMPGRLGGDEFLIIQPFIKDKEDPSILADRILDTVAAPVQWDNTELKLNLSIGISVYPDDSTDIEGLIHCADTAMYSIKQRGGNGYNFFT